MRLLKSAALGAVAGAAMFVGVMGGALAQDHKYSTGASPTPPELKQSVPSAPIFRDFLPPAVDLSKYMPAVGDQGNMGSCVGWATAYAARAYYAEQVEHLDNSQPENIPSPGWIFNIIHLGKDCNGGAYIPDAMVALKGGSYSMAEFPYDDTKCPRPLPPVRSKATGFKIDSFEKVWDQQQSPDLDQVKGALAQGNPVVIIASLDTTFFDLNAKKSIWKASATAKDEGGHAVTIVGYDDDSQTFKFINQWTTQWGNKGYARMTYNTFKARVYEGYIMHLPGDPQVTLSDTDFVADVSLDTSDTPNVPNKPVITPVAPVVPDAPVFKPPFNVKPTDASRDVLAASADPIDIGMLQCGKVDFVLDADGNKLATGFVGSQAELDRVDEALKGKVDDNQVTLAPWPACEVKLTLAASLAEADAPKVAVDPATPKVGDALNVAVETPGFASYLYAAYFSADGNVLNITQPGSDDLKAKSGHTVLHFGDIEAGEMALNVSAPVGDEMLLVVSSEKPLFASALPETQTDRQFLSALREGMLAGDAGRVTATLLPVTTTE